MYCKEEVDGKECGGPVKPDIVFFGEGLPPCFTSLFGTISNNCDLMIVMGTGLAVGPFNQMVTTVKDECPKVLINLENTDYSGFDFVSKYTPERLFLKGKCDDVVTKIVRDCGWIDEFKDMTKDSKNQVDPSVLDELLKDMEQIDNSPKEEPGENKGDDI